MSGLVRVILMAILSFSMIIIGSFWVKKCDEERRKNSYYSEDHLTRAKKANYIYVFSNFVFLVVTWILAYPKLIPESYNRLIVMIVFFLGTMLVFIGYYVVGADMDGYCITLKERIGTYTISVGVLIHIFCIIFVIFSFFDFSVIERKELVEQKEAIEIIRPEYVGGFKIGYIKDENKYVYGYKNDDGVWFFEEGLIVEPENVKNSQDTYIEKHITTKTYVDKERRTGSDGYKSTRDEEKYTLYLNPEQMVEIENNN